MKRATKPKQTKESVKPRMPEPIREPRVCQTGELTQELLKKATEIYCKHAWGRAPTEGELYDMRLEAVLEQNEHGTFECRMGCQDICAGNMKITIARRDGVFLFYVYENDYGAPEVYKKRNQRTARKIEEEWARNGINVFPKADSGKKVSKTYSDQKRELRFKASIEINNKISR